MRSLLIILLFPFLAFPQDFVFEMEYDSIPLEVYGYNAPGPWTGGYWRSSPAATDLDGDGDFDLLVGSYIQFLHSFINEGDPNNPQFTFGDDQFAGIDCSDYVGFLNPVFCDIDDDGDSDLFIGTGAAVIMFYENIGTAALPVYELAEDTLKDENGEWIWGEHPDWVDLDADGDYDFICGRWTGTMRYYENIGDSAQYTLRLITEEFAGINMGYQNHVDPHFCDIDADGDYDLFVGNRWGYLYFYENTGTPQQYNFADPVYPWLGIDVGDYASPEFCDIDADGDYDLFIGKDNDDDFTTPGAVHFWENIGDSLNPNFVEITQSYLTFDAGYSTSTDLCDIDQDGDLDLFFMTNAQLGWMENVGSIDQPSFSLRTYNLIGALLPGSCDLANIIGNNLPDLVVADGYGGNVTLYQNIGSPDQPIFQDIGNLTTGRVINEVTLADLNADGDQDMLIGAWESYPSNPSLLYYENIGTPTLPNFVFITSNYQNIPEMNLGEIVPCAADVDIDGDFDLLLMYNFFTSEIWYFENVGTPQQAQLDSVTNNLLGIDLYLGINADCGDIDADGDADVFGGRAMIGGVNFFHNVTGENEVGPRRPYISYPKLDFSPNPANPVTWISFTLPAPQEATVAVYNILGAKITTLASGLQMPGTHNIIWNASQYSSGVYIIRLETPQEAVAKRVMVVK